MHSSARLQFPPLFALSFSSCDKVYHKQVVCFILFLLDQIVNLQIYNNKPNPMDYIDNALL